MAATRQNRQSRGQTRAAPIRAAGKSRYSAKPEPKVKVKPSKPTKTKTVAAAAFLQLGEAYVMPECIELVTVNGEGVSNVYLASGMAFELPYDAADVVEALRANTPIVPEVEEPAPEPTALNLGAADLDASEGQE